MTEFVDQHLIFLGGFLRGSCFKLVIMIEILLA